MESLWHREIHGNGKKSVLTPSCPRNPSAQLHPRLIQSSIESTRCRSCPAEDAAHRDSPGGTAGCPLEWEENCSKLSWPLLHGLPEQKLDIFFLLDHLPLTALWNSPVFPVAQDRPESGGSRHFQTVTSTGQDPGAGTAPSPLCRRGERLSLFSDCDGNVRLKSLHSPPVPASPLPGKRRRNSRCRGQPLLRLRFPELPRG